MNFLQQQIKDSSQKYYTTGKSDLTDAEFDSLLEKERQQNPNSELLNVGHGYDVDEDSTYGEKVSHRYGLVGSLPKCRNYKEFISEYNNYIDGRPIIIFTPKLDGLSVVCYFENGKFVQAVTRGNGVQGIDITSKIKEITKLDFILDESFTGAIRGEIVMSYKNFETFHKIHPESKNPRNSVAGLMNNKEITSDLYFVDVVFYTIMGSESHHFTSYLDVLNFLKENLKGQKIVNYNYRWISEFADEHWRESDAYAIHISNDNIPIKDLNKDDFLLEMMSRLKSKWYGTYPCDGIVAALDELDVSGDVINYVSNAYKFKAESKRTVVTDIDWNLSKTGYLIPRIKFEPIQLSGATVQFCAGHNAENIKELGLGIGSEIQVTRSNEVIPYLEEVFNKEPYELPRICPSCGEKLITNGVHLQCPNRECKNTDVQDALIWMSNIAPVDGLGDTLKLKYLGELLGEDNISVACIYKHGPIHNTYSQYVKEKLFNETFNRLFTDEIRLESAILALNIPRFGDITAGKLAKYSDEIQACYIEGKKVGAFDQIQYREVLKSIGNANYQSLIDNEYKMYRLNYIKDQIKWTDDSGSEFRGEVCITGKLSVKRSNFEEELRKAGYVAIGSVKKDTKYLITDNPNSGTSKNKNADKYGIPKVTEQEFRTKYM